MPIPANAQARLDILFSEDASRLQSGYGEDGALSIELLPCDHAQPVHIHVGADGKAIVTPFVDEPFDGGQIISVASPGPVRLRVSLEQGLPVVDVEIL